MNRMNGRVTGNPSELGVDFEPSCLVRTPSGNVYIPSGNLSEYLLQKRSNIYLFIKKSNKNIKKIFQYVSNVLNLTSTRA